MGIEEMKNEISRFIDEYWGTDIGQRVYHMRRNTYDTDYDGIKDIAVERNQSHCTMLVFLDVPCIGAVAKSKIWTSTAYDFIEDFR